MPQGRAGTSGAAGRHRAPSESANVSKLKRTGGGVGIVGLARCRAASRLTIAPRSAARVRPDLPFPAAHHRPTGTRTRCLSDTKHGPDIDYRMLFYGTDRDNRASQCAAFRPGLALRSG